MANIPFKQHDDTEVRAFEEGLLRSVDQMKRGEFARTHTTTDIAQYKARGRPVGSTKLDAKQAIKIRFDPDVLAALRALGKGWQTRVNDTMRTTVGLHHERVAT